MKTLKLSATLMALTLLLIPSRSVATVYYSEMSGAWTNALTWTTVGCGTYSPASSYPSSPSDVVYICPGHTVYIAAGSNVTCGNLDVSGTLNIYFGTPSTINVYGDLIIHSTGRVYQAPNAVSTTSNLNLGGNFTNNGRFDGYLYAGTTGRLDLNMIGSGNQVIGGTPTSFILSSLFISNTTGIVSLAVNMDTGPGGVVGLNYGTRLDCNTYGFTGSGSFNMANGSTLGIGSPAGITTAGNYTGNIQTVARYYSVGASYIYNGTSAQATGNGLPATVSNLTLANTGGAVTFNGARTITGNFSIAAGAVANLGSYSHTAGTLTLGGNGTMNGTHGSSSSGATYQNDTYFAASGGMVTVTTSTYEPLLFTYEATDITCFGANDGTITIMASGGSGSGYQYRIYNGATWIGWQDSNVFQDLSPGTYTIEVKDGNGVVQTECP